MDAENDVDDYQPEVGWKESSSREEGRRLNSWRKHAKATNGKRYAALINA